MMLIIVPRMAHSVITLFGISMIVFAVLFLVPGDVAERIAGENATNQVLQNIRAQYGLDQPVYMQYLKYLGAALKGDLGESYVYHKPVSQAIREKLPATVQLALAAGVLEIVLGLPLGIFLATRANTWVDTLGTSVSVLFNSFPPFWLGLMLIFVFGFVLGVLPMGGYGTPDHIVLPALTVAARATPWLSRLTRSNFLEIIRQDFILVARGKGMSSRRILLRHALPNVILPIVTMWSMDFAFFFSGLVIVEAVFAWPGLGWQGWTAVRNRDIPLVMGTVLFSSVVVLTMNLFADVLNTWIDPRSRNAGK